MTAAPGIPLRGKQVVEWPAPAKLNLFLHITGRRKHMFITSFGRNVSPEWVERELTLQAAIAQAAVFGEARPYNVAVIVRAPGASDAAVNQAVALANQGLPDYAQVGRWIEADAPFSLDNDQLTATLRLRRRALWAHYGTRIEAVYEPSMQQEELRA